MIILVDFDHTISDAAWRDSLMGDWEAYFKDAMLDPPIEAVILMVNALHAAGNTIVICTARNERYRKLSVEWLVKYRVHVDLILMRPENDYKRSPELKIDLARQQFGPDLKGVGLVIDDRDDVLQKFREAGIMTLQTTYTGLRRQGNQL